MRWTVSEFEHTCGSCGHLIVKDQPIALVTEHALIRCRACVGEPVNEKEVELERFRIENDERQRLARIGGDPRIPSGGLPHRRRELQPFSAVANKVFDPKKAAAGERDD